MDTNKVKVLTLSILETFVENDFSVNEVLSTVVSVVVNIANNEDKEYIKTVFDAYATVLNRAKKQLLQEPYTDGFIFVFPFTDEILANTVKEIMKGG